MTDRLVAVARWLRDRPATAELTIGYFGANTGAAAALRGAVQLQPNVGAVVSRGGRVDMAAEILGEVATPTLFIIGGEDAQVLELNEEAYEQLQCEKDLRVIAGAGHLFEGPGELEEVANFAGEWFATHLA